jgi:hypothetical protein
MFQEASRDKKYFKMTVKHFLAFSRTKQIASTLGLTFIGNVEVCKACTEAKVKQKSLLAVLISN